MMTWYWFVELSVAAVSSHLPTQTRDLVLSLHAKCIFHDKTKNYQNTRMWRYENGTKRGKDDFRIFPSIPTRQQGGWEARKD